MRKAVIANEIFPVYAGSALKNKGIQLTLDAVVDYLPSPLDIPAVKGIDPRNGEEVTRHASDEEPFCALAFKLQNDPFVGQLTYFRVYSGTISSGTSIVIDTDALTIKTGTGTNVSASLYRTGSVQDWMVLHPTTNTLTFSVDGTSSRGSCTISYQRAYI